MHWMIQTSTCVNTKIIPAQVHVSECIFSAPCWTWLKNEISNHGIVRVGKDLWSHHSNFSVCACGCLKELREQVMSWTKGCAFRNACKLRAVSSFLSSQNSDIPEGACRSVHTAGSCVRPQSWSQGMYSCLQSSISVIQQPWSTSKQAF